MAKEIKVQQSLLSKHAPNVLACLQWQGDRNDCGPFTTATVINALLQKTLDAASLARQMEKPVWRGPLFVVRRVPNWATFPWGMVDVLREHGLKASWRFFSKPEHLWEGLNQDIVLMPIVGSWKPLWAHVMTLVAYSPEKGWGFANTQYSHRDIHWLDNQTFLKQWRAMGRMLITVQKPERQNGS